MKTPIEPRFNRINPLPTIPEVVKNTAAMYKKKGESEKVGSGKALISGHIYYCATFVQGKFESNKTAEGYLIIREDGSVPPFSEAKKPLRMINSTDGMFGKYCSRGRTMPTVRRIIGKSWRGFWAGFMPC